MQVVISRRLLRRILTLTLAAIVLSNCGHTPLMSVYKLNKIKPDTTNLEKLRVAVQVPSTFKTTRKGVILTALLEGNTKEPSFSEKFKLENLAQEQIPTTLKRYIDPTKTLYVFKISKEDIPRFERFRALKAGIQGDEKRTGSISVTANVCRDNDLFPSKIEVSIFLKTSETKEFVPLVLNNDILEGEDAINPDDIAPACT